MTSKFMAAWVMAFFLIFTGNMAEAKHKKKHTTSSHVKSKKAKHHAGVGKKKSKGYSSASNYMSKRKPASAKKAKHKAKKKHKKARKSY